MELFQIVTAQFIAKWDGFVTDCDSLVYYKVQRNYYELRQLSFLQSAMDSYYKLRHLSLLKCDGQQIMTAF